jgi:hypothetical protein
MTIRPRPSASTLTLLFIGAGSLLGGCQKPPLKPLNPCLVSGVTATVSVTNIDKVDLLFMVDNSGSMTQEQAALRREFPRMIQVLTTGDRDGDTVMDFPPAKDLHLGVVSSDLGLVGVANAGELHCPDFGDDGLLLNMPRDPMVPGCNTMPGAYPKFLTYMAPGSSPLQTAIDFACISALGTGGCGFEQQLEAILKAVWPPAPASTMPAGTPPPTPMGGPFLGLTPAGTPGHGDLENAGFIRNDPMQGLSLIALVLVSDEEDCSSFDTHHFALASDVPPGDPLRNTPNFMEPNLRCFDNPQNLWPVSRYIDGYKQLRATQPQLVIFAGIVGVPQELVEPSDLAAVDFSDPAQANAFYDGILSAPAMMETVDTTKPPGMGNLRPSCQSSSGTAYPPRRIVEVAKGFGQNGVIQSICQEDFGPALDAIIDVIARQLGAVCLPRTLVRDAEGLVGCNVVWELPLAKDARAGVPVRCGDMGYEFLMPPEAGNQQTNEAGGAICVVPQLAVSGTGTAKAVVVPTLTNGVPYDKGWYYDDFSPEVLSQCTGASKQRIAFSKDAPPPSGVTVRLECLNESQTLSNTRTDINPDVQQPSVGGPCRDQLLRGQLVSGDEACIIQLDTATPSYDTTTMFCHPELNVCVLGCETNADCPAAWVCDTRQQTVERAGNKNLCVNPTCGDLNN